MKKNILPFVPWSFTLGVIAFVLTLLADQLSKYWILYGIDLPARGSIQILPFLNFTLVWNRAITFGMFGWIGSSGRYVFSGVSLFIVCVLWVWMYRTPYKLTAICVGTIAGGAVGNVIDRFHYGAVVDFLHAHAFGWSWYVFNVADSAIVCSVCVLLLQSFLSGRRQNSQEHVGCSVSDE